jgi:hypothetical protein
MKSRAMAAFVAVLGLALIVPATPAAAADYELGIGESTDPPIEYDQRAEAVNITRLTDEGEVILRVTISTKKTREIDRQFDITCDSTKPGFKVSKKPISGHHTDLTVRCFTQR